jgi:tRNA pseudouridine38-40 synthase
MFLENCLIMARYKIILAYDGTDFSGFQRQKNCRTVQGVLEDALRNIGWAGTSIVSAGRTDSGVHAVGQVIAVEVEWFHSTGQLQRAINTHLPPDVSVRSAELVADEFHPRYSALARRYQYCLFCDEIRHPMRERYAWRVWPPVSLMDLQNTASYLVGIHDFAAFGTPPRKDGPTIREIFEAHWRVEFDGFVFDVVGNAFLYRMVRRLVYLQVAIGQGIKLPEEMIRLLQAGGTTPVTGLAPARGLSLVEVIYPPESGGNDEK